MSETPKNLDLYPKASRRSEIDPFIVMDVLARANERARAGEAIIHMEVGQPSTPAPALVIEAAKRAAETDLLGYSEALGIAPLRERIARHTRETYGVDVCAERVIITTGSSAGFVLAFLAAFDAGARVGLASPGYPCYRHILKTLGNEAVILKTDAASRWAPRVEDVERAHSEGELSGLLLASPANPTGTMVSDDDLRDLTKAAERLGICFISDEIYHGLTYERAASSALQFLPSAIVINSFSKYFSMTGWRIGWMIVPEHLVRVVERLQQNLFISAPTLSQFAALAAFDAIEELEGYKQIYADNRALLLDAFSGTKLGNIAPADGAFYLYADVSDLCDDSAAYGARMLEEIGVAVTPGLDFDEERGKRYLRFSYAGSYENMSEAARRIRGWLK